MRVEYSSFKGTQSTVFNWETLEALMDVFLEQLRENGGWKKEEENKSAN